ncbi:MAG: DUF4872 domain-containing protein [Planctomycetota bacterium]
MRIDGFRSLGGTHGETAALTNLLAWAGHRNPFTGKALREAEVFGIAGGIGAGLSFCPSIPRYGLGGGVGVVGRHRAYSFDGSYQRAVLDRLGIEAAVQESSTPKAGTKKLAGDLVEGRPVLVWCARLLPWFGGPSFCSSCSVFGHNLVVFGLDEDVGEVEVADLPGAALRLAADALAKARGAICTHKNRQLTIEPAGKALTKTAVEAAVRAGLDACITDLREPRIKTFGLPGLERFARQVANTKAKDGWPRFFADGKLYWPLKDCFATIETEGTGGGLMRPLFASFLDAAAKVLGKPGLKQVAKTYRRLGKRWTALAEAALPSEVPAFARTKALLRERNALLAEGGADALAEVARLATELDRLQRKELARFPLDEADRMALLEGLSRDITALHRAECAALDELAATS